jgi:hypothetical protein
MKLQMKREALSKMNRKANDATVSAQERLREGVLAQWKSKLEILQAGASEKSFVFLSLLEFSGATRRDRTGDLLITN